MWIMIGILVLAAVGWVALGNRHGGNSPIDWMHDIPEEMADSMHERIWGGRDDD